MCSEAVYSWPGGNSASWYANINFNSSMKCKIAIPDN